MPTRTGDIEMSTHNEEEIKDKGVKPTRIAITSTQNGEEIKTQRGIADENRRHRDEYP